MGLNASSKKKGGGGSLVIDDDNFFASTAARDAYFVANPTKLTSGKSISVAGELQKRVGTAWVDVTPVVQGAAGASSPVTKLQYSTTGDSAWSNTLDAANHIYWRWSVDNGVTWSANFVKFKGEAGGGGYGALVQQVIQIGGKAVMSRNFSIQQAKQVAAMMIAAIALAEK